MAELLKHAYWAWQKGNPVEALVRLLPGFVGDAALATYNFHRSFGRLPNRSRPSTAAEHLLNLKLSPEMLTPARVRASDKFEVKDIVDRIIGSGHTAKTYAVLTTEKEIRGYDFPRDCVIKATHDSGGVFIRKAGKPVDLDKVCSWLRRNYYWVAREPNYMMLQRRVIVEELLVQPGKDVPQDFKVFCFQGVPAFIQVDDDRFTGHKRSFYSVNWQELNLTMNYPKSQKRTPPPAGLQEMLAHARKLSAEFSFLRVDFFQVGHRVVVGELTNCPEGGQVKFGPEPDANEKVGAFFLDPSLDAEKLFAGSVAAARPQPAREALAA